MCLVEVKKSPKPVVSCAMSAKSTLAASAEIYTNSPLVKKSRENIMEFLLLNHPLDCPICDQGGECDLQDQSLFFGVTKKRFYGYRRAVSDKNLGLIVKTVMTRCIHCTRCVRFATEIAGVQDLGTFGRGTNVEIGTYVSKIFDSELSGNVVDLCPVGALTSKPYPFAGRSWELKKVSSVDPSDGYGSNILVFLKNNVVFKILPGFKYGRTDGSNLWLSNKTRFLFDHALSSRKNVDANLGGDSGVRDKYSWNFVLRHIAVIVYVSDHLRKHFFKLNPFLILFDESSSVEIISILMILERRYTFFQLRRSATTKLINDFQSDFQMNSVRNFVALTSSDTCILLGTNPRYESTYLNLRLKKRYAMGRFQVFSINSRINLTFPCINLGSNLEKLKHIVEGNVSSCNDFKKSSNLVTILNTETYAREDSFAIKNLIKVLDSMISSNNSGMFNLLSTSLNSVGISNLYSFKNLRRKDLDGTSGLFIINSDAKTSFILNQYIQLAVLNYLTIKTTVTVEQNVKNNFSKLVNRLDLCDYVHLPNDTFFEDSGSYINTEGESRISKKILVSPTNTKSDWMILRKLTSMLESIEFISYKKDNAKIKFRSDSILKFRNLISFLFLNTQRLSCLSFYGKIVSQEEFLTSKHKTRKFKLSATQFKIWIEDFYIGGFDNYSGDSRIMILCSLSAREVTHTFL
jgi:NADH dehydrogenase/NADH:ubiquinone oxidoreductase subunit G